VLTLGLVPKSKEDAAQSAAWSENRGIDWTKVVIERELEAESGHDSCLLGAPLGEGLLQLSVAVSTEATPRSCRLTQAGDALLQRLNLLI